MSWPPRSTDSFKICGTNIGGDIRNSCSSRLFALLYGLQGTPPGKPVFRREFLLGDIWQRVVGRIRSALSVVERAWQDWVFKHK